MNLMDYMYDCRPQNSGACCPKFSRTIAICGPIFAALRALRNTAAAREFLKIKIK